MITAEEIKRANSEMPKTDIKGKNYATVPARVAAFRQMCPMGSITTEIISLEAGVVTMRTTVKDEAGNVLSTGLAQEKEGSSYINKTSFIENCETSAVGRALGMLGIGSDADIATAEEVANAITNQDGRSGPQKGRRDDFGGQATERPRRSQKQQGGASAGQEMASTDDTPITDTERATLEAIIHAMGLTPEQLFTNKNTGECIWPNLTGAQYVQACKNLEELKKKRQKAAS